MHRIRNRGHHLTSLMEANDCSSGQVANSSSRLILLTMAHRLHIVHFWSFRFLNLCLSHAVSPILRKLDKSIRRSCCQDDLYSKFFFCEPNYLMICPFPRRSEAYYDEEKLLARETYQRKHQDCRNMIRQLKMPQRGATAHDYKFFASL